MVVCSASAGLLKALLSNERCVAELVCAFVSLHVFIFTVISIHYMVSLTVLCSFVCVCARVCVSTQTRCPLYLSKIAAFLQQFHLHHFTVSLSPLQIEAGDFTSGGFNLLISQVDKNQLTDFMKLMILGSIGLDFLKDSLALLNRAKINKFARYAISKCLLFSDVLKVIMLRKRRNSLSWH